jgi:hypothetical protein
MSANDPDLQPDTAEVLQVEEPEGTVPAVDVAVTNPVRTQSLPRKAGATFNRDVTTTITELLRADHRRARALIVADATIYLAFSEASAQDPSRMALWPALEPFDATATTDLWVRAETGTANVSVITEMWATGETA